MIDQAESDGAHAGGAGPRKVWASLITNASYIPGILTLEHSLKRSDTRYPFVALYTEGLPTEAQQMLDARKILRKLVEFVVPPSQRDYPNEPRFYDTWTKLTVFTLTEFERVVLLDSDMVVLQNMDELMDIQLDPPTAGGRGSRVFAASHACSCNPLNKSHYPEDWIPEKCAFTTQHGDPEKAQIEGPLPNAGAGMLNSGALVVNPTMGVYQSILEKMEDKKAMASYAFPDQALLSDVFRDRWVALPYIYNALKTLRWESVHDAIWRDDRVKNVHFILSPKPWAEPHGEMADPTHLWWREMNEDRLKAEKALGQPVVN